MREEARPALGMFVSSCTVMVTYSYEIRFCLEVSMTYICGESSNFMAENKNSFSEKKKKAKAQTCSVSSFDVHKTG